MTSIQEKRDAAEQQYHAAVELLEAARQAYEEGAGKAYAQALEHKASLSEKLTKHRQDAEKAEATFKALMAKSGFEVTKEVRNALFAKNDANAIAEEINAAVAHLEQQLSGELLEEASLAGDAYSRAYQSACRAAIEFHTYKALATAGEEIAKVMAMRPYVPNFQSEEGWEKVIDFEDLRASLVLQELKAMAEECSGTQYREPLGRLDFGKLGYSRFLSPVMIHRSRQARANSVSPAMNHLSMQTTADSASG